MWLSNILLRWYKSFNNRFVEYRLSNEQSQYQWERYGQEWFPFVEVPVDRQITTVVGANESGKSHLLSAVSKVLTGHGVGHESAERYAIQNICRYCAFEGLNNAVWPDLGIEISFDAKEEYEKWIKSLDLTPTQSAQADRAYRCTIIISGSRLPAQYAEIFSDNNSSLGFVEQTKWFGLCNTSLPALAFINAHIALSNEVHVSQLLDLYDAKIPVPVADPMLLQGLAETLLKLSPDPAKAPNAADSTQYKNLCEEIAKLQKPLGYNGALEVSLFRDVLGVSRDALAQIATLGASDRGYVERLVREINHQIGEVLDITQYWEQDDQFRLTVDYKAGFFYFEITDKTGSKYTFNERSSGLRYFLSYYIQAKAIERANSQRGSIVLMDEPDSFLSIAGQRSLLRVFETLAAVSSGKPSCQLIYTTHSPFLINRNFPSRLRLVRKGEGSEGTQHVKRADIRRYEPIRSALSVDCAETLFMGATNIVLEGISDQRVIVAGIQQFGQPGKLDAFLDLNKVFFVSAGGAPYIRKLVERSLAGDERQPTVVALLDGDIQGSAAYQAIISNKILEKEYVTTLDQIEGFGSNVKVLEDIIPAELFAPVVQQYLASEFNTELRAEDIYPALKQAGESTMAERLIRAIRDKAQNIQLEDHELKGGLVDTFIEILAGGQFRSNNGLKEFEKNIRIICAKLREMIDSAERRTRRESMHKCVKLEIQAFERSHRSKSTRAELELCLARLESECAGTTQEARHARENVNDMKQQIAEEASNARDPIDIAKWQQRLQRFAVAPWRQAPATKNKNLSSLNSTNVN